MGPLMPQVLADVAAVTRARFELVVVENTLFGPSVTTAGLLPASAIEAALEPRGNLDLVWLPAEAVNDDLVFMDDVSADELAGRPHVSPPVTDKFRVPPCDCGIKDSGLGVVGATC